MYAECTDCPRTLARRKVTFLSYSLLRYFSFEFVVQAELLPKYIRQDAKQGPSSQFAERAESGLKACPSRKGLCGPNARALVPSARAQVPSARAQVQRCAYK